jgi:hypothetical protein
MKPFVACLALSDVYEDPRATSMAKARVIAPPPSSTARDDDKKIRNRSVMVVTFLLAIRA